MELAPFEQSEVKLNFDNTAVPFPFYFVTDPLLLSSLLLSQHLQEIFPLLFPYAFPPALCNG